MVKDSWHLDGLVRLSELAPMPWGDDSTVEDDKVAARAARLRMVRHRSADFPTARGGTSDRSATYRLGDLLDWFAAHGQEITVPVEWIYDRAVDPLATAIGAEAARRHAMARIGEAAGGVSSPPVREALSRLEQPEADPVLDQRLRDAIDDVVSSGLRAAALAGLAERTLARTTATARKVSHATAPGLAELLVAAAGVSAGASVYDPAAGEGSTLLATARAGAQPIVGRENDSGTHALATVRCFMHRIDVDLGNGPSDSLTDLPAERFDHVVIDAPLDDPKAWLQAALRSCAPHGTAAVALTAASLDSPRLVEDFRRHTTAVVLTPDRVRSDTGSEIAVWVLHRERSERAVRLVDASALGVWQGRRKTITNDHLAAIENALQGRHSAGASITVDGADIDRVGSLEPRRYLETPDAVMEAVNAALEHTTCLNELLSGPLATRVTEEHRRAVQRLADRLTSELRTER